MPVAIVRASFCQVPDQDRQCHLASDRVREVRFPPGRAGPVKQGAGVRVDRSPADRRYPAWYGQVQCQGGQVGPAED